MIPKSGYRFSEEIMLQDCALDLLRSRARVVRWWCVEGFRIAPP